MMKLQKNSIKKMILIMVKVKGMQYVFASIFKRNKEHFNER